MRSNVALALLLVLVMPMSATAQDGSRDAGDEAIYQGLWCLYLHARPFLVDVPADVTCEYEPRAMTKEEAGAYYLAAVDRSNNAGDRWNCAGRQSSGTLSWKQNRMWATRYLKASKQFTETLRMVRWPADANRKIKRLIDLSLEDYYRTRRAYNHRSFQDSVASGDWGRAVNAPNKASPVAETVRAALGIRHVPDAPNPCKAVRRYEKREKRAQKVAAEFQNPYTQRNLKRIAALAAQAGLVQGAVNDAGEPALFLTEEGLATARAIPVIPDDASPQDVVTGLFSLASQAANEPMPSPELVELAPVMPEQSPDTSE